MNTKGVGYNQSQFNTASLSLAHLRGKYGSVDDPGVTAFLRRHPMCVVTLAEVYPKLIEAFGDKIKIRLETPNFDYEELVFVRIYGHGISAEDAFDQLEARAGWWYELTLGGISYLNIGLGWQ
jgi:hypothetical protein